MHLIQFINESNMIVAGIVKGEDVFELKASAYDLIKFAIEMKISIIEHAKNLKVGVTHQYQTLARSGRLHTPIHHMDPSHLLVTGTGLTHHNSVMTRASMEEESKLTDAQKIYLLGTHEGQPYPNKIGAIPEWFFKGFGYQLSTAHQVLNLPAHTQGGGEEAELVAIYMVSSDCQVHRIGFSLGNEFSDHVLEKQNHYYLAQSKLIPCSFGPELYIGEMPTNMNGKIEILRDQDTLWRKSYMTGAKHMVHSIENIEHHVFKHEMFRTPGDIHILFLGADQLSFQDDVEILNGDVISIQGELFQHPLINQIQLLANEVKYEVISC